MGQKQSLLKHHNSPAVPAMNELMRRLGCVLSGSVEVIMTQAKHSDWGAIALHYQSQTGGRDVLVWLGSTGFGYFEAICEFKLFFFDGSRKLPKRLPYDKAKTCFVTWKWTGKGDEHHINARSVTWSQT